MLSQFVSRDIDGLESGALFSQDLRHRYLLWRTWDGSAPVLALIMLNPSMSDHELTRQTLKRVVTLARDRGYGSVQVVNLYALRTPHPRDLFRALDPVGDIEVLNALLVRTCHDAQHIVCAWGAHAKAQQRAAEVLTLMDAHDLRSKCRALGLTQDGSPRHPLYVPGVAHLQQF